MPKILLFINLMFLLSGCASTVNVELVDSKILDTSNDELGRSGFVELPKSDFKAVQFDITSKEELYKFFVADRYKPIQIFCKAIGATRKGDFSNIGYGPYYGKEDISRIFEKNPNGVIFESNSENGEYKYKIIAFLKLEAGYTQLHYGVPETALDLTTESFDSLVCNIVGGTYPPMIPPRSNEFGINRSEFDAKLKEYFESHNGNSLNK